MPGFLSRSKKHSRRSDSSTQSLAIPSVSRVRFSTRATKNLLLIRSVPPRSLFYLSFLSPLSFSAAFKKARWTAAALTERESVLTAFLTGLCGTKYGRAHGAGLYKPVIENTVERSDSSTRKARRSRPLVVSVYIRQLFSPPFFPFLGAARGPKPCQTPGRQPSLSDRPIVVQCCTPSLDPLVTIRCLWPKERVVAPPQAERTAHRSSSSSLSSLSSSASSFSLSLSFDELLGLTPNAVTNHRFIGSLESGTNVLTTH